MPGLCESCLAVRGTCGCAFRRSEGPGAVEARLDAARERTIADCRRIAADALAARGARGATVSRRYTDADGDRWLAAVLADPATSRLAHAAALGVPVKSFYRYLEAAAARRGITLARPRPALGGATAVAAPPTTPCARAGCATLHAHASGYCSPRCRRAGQRAAERAERDAAHLAAHGTLPARHRARIGLVVPRREPAAALVDALAGGLRDTRAA